MKSWIDAITRTILMVRGRRETAPQPVAPVDTRPIHLFFAPEAGVGPHFASHCVIARTLQERGHRVLFLRCNRIYRHCVVMEMLAQDVEKSQGERDEACTLCQANHDQMTTAYGLPSLDMSELVDEAMIAKVGALVAAMPADAGLFEVEGIRFGALCSSDLALATKTLDQLNATGAARQRLEAYVFGALLSFFAVKALLEREAVARLIFFNEYGMLAGGALAAMKAGIPITRMTQANHKNVDRSRVVLLHRPLGTMSSHEALDHWADWRDIPLSPRLVETVGDNIVARMSGQGFTVYSPKLSGQASDLFASLGLSRQRKTLVAYTSSLDELNANRNLMSAFGVDLFQKQQPFADQLEWLTALVDHVERSADLQLIIRIHPREAPNQREGTRSEHLPKLQAALSGRYQHTRVIWPEEQISSYDLAEIADVALPAWSNISIELAQVGVPVVVAFQRYVPFPVPDVLDWAATPQAYFQLFREVLARDPSFERMRQVYRWAHRYSLAIAVDLHDLVPSHDYAGLPPWHTPAAGEAIENILIEGRSVVEINREALLADPTADVEAETAALIAQIERTRDVMMQGRDSATSELSQALLRLDRLAQAGRAQLHSASAGAAWSARP
jgi:hypothetical protein